MIFNAEAEKIGCRRGRRTLSKRVKEEFNIGKKYFKTVFGYENAAKTRRRKEVTAKGTSSPTSRGRAMAGALETQLSTAEVQHSRAAQTGEWRCPTTARETSEAPDGDMDKPAAGAPPACYFDFEKSYL